MLDKQSKSPLVYEVLVDESTKEILTGSPVDPQTYWQSEETAFREHYAEHILTLVSQQEGIESSDLSIVNGILDHYALAGQMVWRGKIEDIKQGQTYEVALDTLGQPIDVGELEKAEIQAQRERYGKLEPRLYYWIQEQRRDTITQVLLWGSGVDLDWVSTELARRYPQVKAHRFSSGQPIDEQGRPVIIDRELFDQIREDYKDLLAQSHIKTMEPIVAFLRTKGYEVRSSNTLPGIVAELPVKVVLELNEVLLENLTAIYSADVEIVPELGSVGGTIRASPAWESGYTGTGVRLGIMDAGIVNPNITHRALQGKVVATNTNDPTDLHAALVAGVMVGDHPAYPQYRGIAYGSDELVSVTGMTPSTIDFLVAHNAFVINASFSTTSTQVMQWEDRVFDYAVRMYDPTIVVSAGAGGGNVKSPGKGYNVITVGAFDDHNDPHWSTPQDTMWAGSSFIDPYIDGQTYAGDREKPEVVAVGVDVTTVDINLGDDGFFPQTGTSVAAPQVSALAGLLIHRYWWLRTNPEAVKAIIMASAIHNIEGSSRLSEYDGAGAIDVAAALAIFEKGGWGYKIIHDITAPGDSTNPFGSDNPYEFDGSDFVIGSTYAEAGERVRAVICWDSNPVSDYSTDPLSTDLDLRAISPGGTVLDSSVSLRNSYEIVDFVAPETGEYKMRVRYYARTPTESQDLGLGLAWLRIPQYEVTYSDYPSLILVEPSSLDTVPVAIHNDGVRTWQASPFLGQSGKTYLSYHWVWEGYDSIPIYSFSSGVWIWDGLRTQLPNDIDFGSSTTLDAQIMAPNTTGRYVLMWDMVEEDVTWFNWQETRVGRTIAIVAPLHYVYLPAVMRNYP